MQMTHGDVEYNYEQQSWCDWNCDGDQFLSGNCCKSWSWTSRWKMKHKKVIFIKYIFQDFPTLIFHNVARCLHSHHFSIRLFIPLQQHLKYFIVNMHHKTRAEHKCEKHRDMYMMLLKPPTKPHLYSLWFPVSQEILYATKYPLQNRNVFFF